MFSFFFHPQPVNSSSASKDYPNTHTTHLTPTSRKSSIYEHAFGIGPDGGVFYNDHFQPAPGGYSACVSKTQTDNEEPEPCDDETGIRVVRELRLESDTLPDTFATAWGAGGNASSPCASPVLAGNEKQDRDLEMGLAAGSSDSWNPTIEWDLGDFEFPDYKERMNAPI